MYYSSMYFYSDDRSVDDIMKKYLKKWICLIVIFAVIAINGSLTVKAAERRVYDYAGLFTEKDALKIEKRVAAFREHIPYDIVIVTTDDTNGKDTMTYADDFYDYGGFGTGTEKSGVLLLIDMENREIWISTCGDMIYILTDQKIDKILDKVYGGVAAEDYKSAALKFIRQTESYVNPLPKVLATGVFSGVMVSAMTCLMIMARYRGKRSNEQYLYKREGGMRMIREDDQFLNSTVTHRKIPKNPPPQSQNRSSGGSASGRSSTHVSSSGRSHGGGGRKF